MKTADKPLKNTVQYIIRSYVQDDIPDIISILKENDLYDENEILSNFFVLSDDFSIVGVVQLAPYPSYYFLSYMAIRTDVQKKGIGGYLINGLLSGIDKPVYLYTIIPEFYEKHGFKIVMDSEILPHKNEDVCRICMPEKCRTMEYVWNQSRIK